MVYLTSTTVRISSYGLFKYFRISYSIMEYYKYWQPEIIINLNKSCKYSYELLIISISYLNFTLIFQFYTPPILYYIILYYIIGEGGVPEFHPHISIPIEHS